MVINDFKDLKRLFKLCRDEGITDFTINGMTFKLGDLPEKRRMVTQDAPEAENPLGEFPDRELTNEELMYYSSGGTQGIAPPEIGGAEQ